MKINGWTTFRAILTGLLLSVQISYVSAQSKGPIRLDEKQLGETIEALGIKTTKQQQRYDFAFEAPLEDEKWQLSLSAVLSQDGDAVWVMAWLDELPKDAAQVPRTALLRLLAINDELGNGKFFAYVPKSRRFVLQRIIPNENLTSAQFREVLQDLGTSVVETYEVWSVAKWNAPAKDATEPGKTPVGGKATSGTPVKNVDNDGKTNGAVRR